MNACSSGMLLGACTVRESACEHFGDVLGFTLHTAPRQAQARTPHHTRPPLRTQCSRQSTYTVHDAVRDTALLLYTTRCTHSDVCFSTRASHLMTCHTYHTPCTMHQMWKQQIPMYVPRNALRTATPRHQTPSASAGVRRERHQSFADE